MVIWKPPAPDPDRPDGYKCRLVYIRDGQRVIGYDNERGKGDHRHDRKEERPYLFTTVAQLLADFRADVQRKEEPL